MTGANEEPQSLATLRKVVEKGDLAAFPAALEAMIATTYRKRWPEAILGDILCQRTMDQEDKTAMVKALLDSKRPPSPRFSTGNRGEAFLSAMELALSARAYDAMLLLHQAGFPLPESEHLLFSSRIGQGEWPYPDIIFPDILLQAPKANRTLFDGIFTRGGMTAERVDRLLRLDHNDDTAKRFAKALATLSRAAYQQNRQAMLENLPTLKAIERMMEVGLLDVQVLVARDNGQALWQEITQRLEAAHLEASLETHTAPATPAPTRGRRL